MTFCLGPIHCGQNIFYFLLSSETKFEIAFEILSFSSISLRMNFQTTKKEVGQKICKLYEAPRGFVTAIENILNLQKSLQITFER